MLQTQCTAAWLFLAMFIYVFYVLLFLKTCRLACSQCEAASILVIVKFSHSFKLNIIELYYSVVTCDYLLNALPLQ